MSALQYRKPEINESHGDAIKVAAVNGEPGLAPLTACTLLGRRQLPESPQ